MLETYWSSELSQLQEMQKREYREWVTKVHEDMVRVNSGNVYFLSFLFDVSFFNVLETISVETVKKGSVSDQLSVHCL